MDQIYSGSIKKDINTLLTSESAIVKLNHVALLHRWQVDALGHPVDGLQISLAYIGGIKGGEMHPIKSRDYDGIMAEVEDIMQDYFCRCAEQMVRNLRNGKRA